MGRRGAPYSKGTQCAGKTGTAQKVDPKTGTYSKTKYIASFVGFAPVNTPALTIAVILDSAEGLHQGGQVCAPVFRRIAQQVLEYMHVPHDLEIKNDARRQTLLASAKDGDTEEPEDHLGAPMVMNNADNDAAPAQNASGQKNVPPTGGAVPAVGADGKVLDASLRAPAPLGTPASDKPSVVCGHCHAGYGRRSGLG